MIENKAKLILFIVFIFLLGYLIFGLSEYFDLVDRYFIEIMFVYGVAIPLIGAIYLQKR
jgi:hypothetical protein